MTSPQSTRRLALASRLRRLCAQCAGGRLAAINRCCPEAAVTSWGWVPAASPSTTAPTPSVPLRAPRRTTRARPGGQLAKHPTRVRPTDPDPTEQLTISRLRLKMPIVATTVDDAGLMALPERPNKIGWYSYGPRPGAKSGSAVLAGHIDSRKYGIGPLAGLRRLSPGDEIVVRTADGSVTFEVRSVQVFNKRALPLSEVFDRDGRPRLRIVSCGGAYLPARGGYQDNVVVTAVPR